MANFDIFSVKGENCERNDLYMCVYCFTKFAVSIRDSFHCHAYMKQLEVLYNHGFKAKINRFFLRC